MARRAGKGKKEAGMDMSKIKTTAIEKSVQNSQMIEGYATTSRLDIKERAKELMDKHHIKVSVQK